MGGRKDVVGKVLVKNLNHKPTILVLQLFSLSNDPTTEPLNPGSLLLYSEPVNREDNGIVGDTRNTKQAGDRIRVNL